MAITPTLYLKAFTIRDKSDFDIVKHDIKDGMILIVRIWPLAQKDLGELRQLIDKLYELVKSEDCEIARLGDERVVITPHGVQIWKPQYDLK